MSRIARSAFLSFFSFLMLALAPYSSFAQQGTASVVGDVTDPRGGAVNGAKVAVSDPSSGLNRETATDEQGHFQFLIPAAGFVLRARGGRWL